MKKTIFGMAAIVFVALTVSTSYGQNIDKKSDKARENILEGKKDVNNANQDLKVAQKDSVADYQNFKKESEARILTNEKTLTDLKVKVSKAELKDKTVFEENLATLNQKQVNLKKRFVDYKLNGETKWSTFKNSFINDLDELEKELKNFTVENKK